MSSRYGNIVTALANFGICRAAGAESGTNPSEETILAAVNTPSLRTESVQILSTILKNRLPSKVTAGLTCNTLNARARSILAKAGGQVELTWLIWNDERVLLRKITQFTEAVDGQLPNLCHITSALICMNWHRSLMPSTKVIGYWGQQASGTTQASESLCPNFT